jgi:hypothetical protein
MHYHYHYAITSLLYIITVIRRCLLEVGYLLRSTRVVNRALRKENSIGFTFTIVRILRQDQDTKPTVFETENETHVKTFYTFNGVLRLP